MTDRELLELAAKAAGLKRRYWKFDLTGEFGMIDDDPDHGFWNPLTDDGDALRLAVKLSLVMYPPRNAGDTAMVEWWGEGKESGMIDEPAGSDWSHDMRRAIVRAAAEIGALK